MISLLLISLSVACNKDTKESTKEGSNTQSISIQQIAYKSLDAGDKVQLVNDKAEGIVERKVVTKRIASLTDEQYDGKEVCAVTFHTKNEALLGDIIVFVDGETQKVIGRGLRE